MSVGIWWSPDSKKLAFYRFDESKIPDYTVNLNQTGHYDRPEVDPYPNAGVPSPVVEPPDLRSRQQENHAG